MGMRMGRGDIIIIEEKREARSGKWGEGVQEGAGGGGEEGLGVALFDLVDGLGGGLGLLGVKDIGGGDDWGSATA